VVFTRNLPGGSGEKLKKKLKSKYLMSLHEIGTENLPNITVTGPMVFLRQ
jgi:hypothetical protein